MKRSRQDLPLERKVYVIRQHEEGKSSRGIARELGVGKTQINNIVRRKQEYLQAFERNDPREQSCRKKKKTGNEEVNKMTYEWFQQAKSKNVPVSGPVIQETARSFARQLGITTFTASNGWLHSFRRRHNIGFQSVRFSTWSKIPLPTPTLVPHVLGGQSAGVNPATITVWKEQLSALCQGYRPDDIWTMNETGLYYKALPDCTRTHRLRGCKGGKLSLSLCCSLMGEKVKPVLIGKTYRPRCFKNLDVDELPVMWKSNESATMTSPTFEDWLIKLNTQMRRQKRNVLLFLKHTTSRPHLTLSNIKLQFFPPDMTLKFQPLDQGVIRAMKASYRKRLLQHLVSLMDSSATATELSRRLTVLDAAYWIAKAWDEISPTTIQNCFEACGFSKNVLQETASSEDNEQQPRREDSATVGPDEETAALLVQIGQHEVVSWQQFVGIDDVMTHDDTANEGDSRSCLSSSSQAGTAAEGDEFCDNSEDEEEMEPDSMQDISLGQVLQNLADLRVYATQKGDAHILDTVMSLRDYVVGNYIDSKPQKQAMITNFFSPNPDI